MMLRNLRNSIISRIAEKHIAGSKIEDALTVCRWAAAKNFSSILSLWPNESTSHKENVERFKSGLITLHAAGIKAHYSIKLAAIGYDPVLFRELLEIAHAHGIRLHADSMDPESAPVAFRLFEQSAEFNRVLGCTIPSRWKRSVSDAERAADLGLPVRIVKGQWADPDFRVDSRANYLAIAEKLAGRGISVGVATHDKPLAEKVLKQLTEAGSNCEMEQFFSLPLNGIAVAQKYNCPYRIYVAYGYPAIPYNYRFALTRPALAAWLASDFAFRFSKPWEREKTGFEGSSERPGLKIYR